MSGFVVRPGDVLVVPLAPGTNSTPDTRAKLKEFMEADLPGVTVLVCEGPAGEPFVYRPETVGDAWADRYSTGFADADQLDGLPDEAPHLAEVARLRQIRRAQERVEREVPDTPPTVE